MNQVYNPTIGKLPNKWSIVRIGSIVKELVAGVSVNSTEVTCRENQFGVLKTSCVSAMRFEPGQNKLILPEDLPRAKIRPRKNSIVISRMNTPDLVGACGWVDKDYDNLFLPDRLWQTVFFEDSAIDSKWLWYTMSTERFRFHIKTIATGTSNSMKNISKKQLLDVHIPLPPLPEQRKIAEILSTWDEAIEKLDQLIEKKKLLKKGLMQQLLTGKKRFPGFTEPWKEVRLGDVVNLINGRAFKPADWGSEGVPIIRIQNLNGSTEYNYYSGSVDPKHSVIDGDLLFSWSGSRGTSFGPFVWHGPTGVLNQHIFKVIPRAVVMLQFIYGLLSYLTIRIERRAHGSAGLVHVTKGQLEKEPLLIPQLDEQGKIGQVFSFTQKEIDLLAAKRNYLNEQKRGLMQQLLTGKTRVKI